MYYNAGKDAIMLEILVNEQSKTKQFWHMLLTGSESDSDFALGHILCQQKRNARKSDPSTINYPLLILERFLGRDH